jgi:hypothetical protein
MTETKQIDLLEERVTRLEERTNQEIVSIHSKLDVLSNLINRSLVESAKVACPSPGACITLSEKLQNTIAAHNATMLRVERLELRIMDMERWQNRTLGAVAILMIALTLFGPAIRHLFRLP